MKSNTGSVKIILIVSVMLFGGLVTLARAGAAAGVKNVTTNFYLPLEETVYNPVTGETVDFSGEVNVIARTKALADGSVKVTIQCDATIPGVGATTGDSYHAKVHSSNTFSFKTTDFPFTVTIQCDMRIANPGSCNEIQVPLTVQFTVQKNGSVSAQYIEEDDGGDVVP